MEPTLDLMAFLNPQAGMVTGASAPGNSLDAETVAAIDTEFTTMLNQALISQNMITQNMAVQNPVITAPAAAQPAETLAATGEIPVDGAETELANANPALPNAQTSESKPAGFLNGFPANLISTVQRLLQPQAEQAAAQPASLEPGTEPAASAGTESTKSSPNTAPDAQPLSDEAQPESTHVEAGTEAASAPVTTQAIPPSIQQVALTGTLAVTATNLQPLSAPTQRDSNTKGSKPITASDITHPSGKADKSHPVFETHPGLSHPNAQALANAIRPHWPQAALPEAAQQNPTSPSTVEELSATQADQADMTAPLPQALESVSSQNLPEQNLPGHPDPKTDFATGRNIPAMANQFPERPEIRSGADRTMPTPGNAIGKPGQKSGIPFQKLLETQEHLDALNGTLELASRPSPESTTEPAPIVPDTTAPLPAQSMESPPSGDSMSLPPGVSSSASVQPAVTPGSRPEIPQFPASPGDIADQVVEGTQYSVKHGHKELVIRLNPDNLGEVRVNLVSHGNGELSARLIASSSESHEVLQNQAHVLKNSLEAQGIQIERLSVVLAGSAEARGDLNQQNQSQQNAHHENRQQESGQQNASAFSQQDQSASNLFSQLAQNGHGGSPHKSPYAHTPGGHSSAGGSIASEASEKSRPETRANDNGHISILA